MILTKKFSSFAASEHLDVIFCRKNDPQSKGRVENAVKHVKYNFLRGRRFVSIEQLQKEAEAWLERTGNGTMNGSTYRIPSEDFKAHEGESVDFKVSRDVVIDGVVAIPAGTLAKGSVYEAKRSTAFGTRGRLGIKVKYMILPSGDYVNFKSTDVYIKGPNRTALSVIIFCYTCLPFPCGGKAEMKQGYEVEATVANNVTVNI